MPQTGIILHLKPLRPLNPIVARRSFHKFYFQLERKFEKVTYQLSKVDPWLEVQCDSESFVIFVG